MDSWRSMPVQNAFSPAPVRMTTRTSSFQRRPVHNSRSSYCICRLNELWTSGRLSVTVATPSSSSYSRVSKEVFNTAPFAPRAQYRIRRGTP